MYRAVALAVIESAIDRSDVESIGALASKLNIDLEGNPEALKVTLNGRDVTHEIRSELVTQVSSVVSAIPGVRRAMVARQQAMGARGAVLNGRDIGTVVFPNADVKFFLTATPDERAHRRFAEEKVLHPEVSLAETFADMVERDRRDSTRLDSPLKVADDAIIIDSSGHTISEVLDKMMSEIRNRSGQLRTAKSEV